MPDRAWSTPAARLWPSPPSPAMATARTRASAVASSSPPRVFVGPVLALPRPVLLVVTDHARVPQLADQLLGEPAGGEVLHLDVELAFLADDRVDLAELRLVEHAADVLVQLVDGRLRELV